MNIPAIKLGAFATMSVLFTILLGVACGGGEPKELEILVKVSGKSMSPNIIKVKEGDLVTLKIEAEEEGGFHIHTYDIEKDIESVEPTDLFFVADATGRFRITFHPLEENEDGHHHAEKEEIDMGFLEVQPR